VTGSHLTSMHSMDNYYVSKLLPLMAEAQLNVVSNPLINITLQGRHDTYPKRRGMTRVPELMAAGVNVAFGHDCVMDPWYSLGSGDMLEVAHMGLHVAQMTSQAQMRACFDAVTVNAGADFAARRLWHFPRLPRRLRAAAGARSDRGIRFARDAVAGLARRGRCVASSPAATATLHLEGRPARPRSCRRRSGG
jgi:cytosine deaminase